MSHPSSSYIRHRLIEGIISKKMPTKKFVVSAKSANTLSAWNSSDNDISQIDSSSDVHLVLENRSKSNSTDIEAETLNSGSGDTSAAAATAEICRSSSGNPSTSTSNYGQILEDATPLTLAMNCLQVLAKVQKVNMIVLNHL